MTMKKQIVSAFIFFAITGITWAQPGPPHRRAQAMERVEEFRMKFYAENLELTQEEAKRFWPIYNDFRAKQEAIKNKQGRMGRVELMSDEEVEKFLIDHLDSEQRLLDLKKDFFRQLRGVLPNRKIALIPRTEQKFRKEIVSEIRQRKQGDRKH